ncbi:MAG TPA: biotin--[acetyl-CoA-carboxylase] ligase [Steroidobacteraceae bacterium]|nr:biotin--[acetyl-CoA-carboxylase] ligase [Steroidobacteraceae bacterium]
MTRPRARQRGPDRGEPTGRDSPLVEQVFAELARGGFQSGQSLAARLSVSRSGIWKAVAALRELGATIHAVRNRGYRLANTADPLDPIQIRDALPRTVRERVHRLETVWTVGSTNTVLMERPSPAVGSAEVLLAEYQTSGRGRRGRSWLAPPGGAICLSLSWTFRDMPRDLGALGLVIGVCSLRALASLGLQAGRLKWPNDLLVDARKLGGILIELRAEAGGPACVVIGIGMNVALGTDLLKRIAQTGIEATDLTMAGLERPSRNTVASALIRAFIEGLRQFEREGLKPFMHEWMEADALRGRPVAVHTGESTSRGIARGIDADGALLVETPQGLQRFISGDVSVRPVQ